MPVYKYEAITRQGGDSSGEITAPDRQSAITRLNESGLTVYEMREEIEKVAKKTSSLFNKKVKLDDLSLFSRQLSVMMEAGIPISQAISTLAEQSPNPSLRAALSDIYTALESGTDLTTAFSRHSKIFDAMYVSMVHSGEMGGTLETVLVRLSEQLQKQKRLNDNIKSAISYPRTVGIFAVVMFIAMIAFLVPMFEDMMPDDAVKSPLTAFVFGLSQNFRAYWYWWMLGAVAMYFGFVSLLKTKLAHIIWENYKMSVPIAGPIIKCTVIARFSRTLATLLHSGIPVVQAMESAGPTAGSDKLNHIVTGAISQIEAGRSVSATMRDSGIIPPMAVNMMAIGEEAGTLPEMLDKVAEFYEEDVDNMSKRLGAMIEPLMLVIIAVMVGGMMIALYGPILESVTSGMADLS